MKGEPVFTSFDDYNYLGITPTKTSSNKERASIMINTFTYSTNSPLNVSTYDHMINILTAIKEGQEVQYRDENTGEWILHDINELPRFAYYEYRVKPETLKYRVGLFMTKNGYHALTVSSDGTADLREHNDPTFIKWFIKWLTDWVEYDCYEIKTTHKQRDNIVSPKY